MISALFPDNGRAASFLRDAFEVDRPEWLKSTSRVMVSGIVANMRDRNKQLMGNEHESSSKYRTWNVTRCVFLGIKQKKSENNKNGLFMASGHRPKSRRIAEKINENWWRTTKRTKFKGKYATKHCHILPVQERLVKSSCEKISRNRSTIFGFVAPPQTMYLKLTLQRNKLIKSLWMAIFWEILLRCRSTGCRANEAHFLRKLIISHDTVGCAMFALARSIQLAIILHVERHTETATSFVMCACCRE